MKKILIIDDSPLMSAFFEKVYFPDIKVVYKQILDPYKTMDAIKEFEPGLIILDVKFNLPIDGVELGLYINKNYNIPIMFHSSVNFDEALNIIEKIKPIGFILKSTQSTYSTENKLAYYSMVNYIFRDDKVIV